MHVSMYLYFYMQQLHVCSMYIHVSKPVGKELPQAYRQCLLTYPLLPASIDFTPTQADAQRTAASGDNQV